MSDIMLKRQKSKNSSRGKPIKHRQVSSTSSTLDDYLFNQAKPHLNNSGSKQTAALRTQAVTSGEPTLFAYGG